MNLKEKLNTALNPFYSINKKDIKALLVSLSCVFLLGAISGFILKTWQIRIVDSSLTDFYPLSFYFNFVIIRVLNVTLYWLINVLILGFLFKLDYFKTMVFIGRLYTVLIIPYLFGNYVSYSKPLFLLLILINITTVFKIGESLKKSFLTPVKNYTKDFAAFSLIFIIYFFIFAPMVDPLVSIFDLKELSYQYLYTAQYVLNYHVPSVSSLQEIAWSPTYAAGTAPLLNPNGSFSGEFLLVFIYKLFNISMADLSTIYYVLKINVFLMFFLCGVGYYLVSRVGFKFPFSVSLFIGILSVINVGITQRHTEIVSGYSICAYPFIILAVKYALDKKNLLYYAIAGMVTTFVFMLVKIEPDVFLGLVYFILLWFVWDIAFKLKDKTEVIFRIKGVGIYLFTCAIVNYPVLASIIDYFSYGNAITSRRIFYPIKTGAEWVAKDLLAIFGFAGMGHITSPAKAHGALFGGLLLSFFVIFGVYSYLKKLVETTKENRNFISYIFISIIVVAVWGYTFSSISYAAYTVNASGFPFHLPSRVLGLYHIVAMVLGAFGYYSFNILLEKNNGQNNLQIVKFTAAYFFIIALYYTLQKSYSFPSSELGLQIAISIIAIIGAMYAFSKNKYLRHSILLVATIFLAIVSQPRLTIFNLDTYHKTVLNGSNIQKTMNSNNFLKRLRHPEYFSAKKATVPLATTLMMTKRDIKNPRTKLFVFNLLIDYKEWILKLGDLNSKKGDLALVKTLSGESNTVNAILDSIEYDYKKIDESVINKINLLANNYNMVFKINETAPTWHLSENLFSIAPDIANFNRVGYDPAKILFGTAMRHLPTNEELIGPMPSISRWYSMMDYYGNNIKYLQTTTDYVYDSFVFPAKTPYFNDILNIKYAFILRQKMAQYPYLKNWTELVSMKSSNGADFLLLKNEKALPRAFTFTNYKVTSPVTYNKYNLNEPSRIDNGRKLLSSINTQQELLIESDDKLDFKINGNNESRDVKILRIIGNFAVFLVNNNTTGSLLFYSDMYHKDWHAFVDGTQVDIYRANLSFKSVYVPNGKHLVWFEFRSTLLFLFKLMALVIANIVLFKTIFSLNSRLEG